MYGPSVYVGLEDHTDIVCKESEDHIATIQNEHDAPLIVAAVNDYDYHMEIEAAARAMVDNWEAPNLSEYIQRLARSLEK